MMRDSLSALGLVSLLVCVGCSRQTTSNHSGEALNTRTKQPSETHASKQTPPPATPEPRREPVPESQATNTQPTAVDPALLDPSRAQEKAPAKYTVKFETTKGDVLIDVTRDWSPVGADRFYNLVKLGYFNDVAFFRVISGFMAQVGINGRPEVNTVWRMARIADDPVTQSNTRGMVSFATSGPNSRTTQFFINFGNNANLDSMGFSPFGKVRDMATIDSLYSGYGEGAPSGRGPNQGRLQGEGNAYLRAEFPQLDYIVRATIAN